MKYNYQNISISKDFYKSAEGFSKTLERLDPSEQYRGTELAGYDAFQRQLKRFDIKVAGADSDRLQKFFATSDSAALFPEYVSRAVKQGVDDNHILEEICAAHTQVEGMDYRAVASDPDWETQSPSVIEEGGFIPETTIHLKDSLIRLRKRGRMMVASYEAIKFQRLDLFTVALKQIGACIGKAQLQDAVDVLINGDGNNNPAGKVDLATKDTLTY
ncbi:MAG TPA: phage major capsid protein, partial [Candidatus Negativibacillus faecipullorum]|nr:phage major capsid protein [Candidatus Negativibacillus faecipullorum]